MFQSQTLFVLRATYTLVVFVCVYRPKQDINTEIDGEGVSENIPVIIL